METHEDDVPFFITFTYTDSTAAKKTQQLICQLTEHQWVFRQPDR